MFSHYSVVGRTTMMMCEGYLWPHTQRSREVEKSRGRGSCGIEKIWTRLSRHGSNEESNEESIEENAREPSLGERVLFCKLIRDGILRHFDPRKLSDLRYVLELRCYKGLLSDEDLIF